MHHLWINRCCPWGSNMNNHVTNQHAASGRLYHLYNTFQTYFTSLTSKTLEWKHLSGNTPVMQHKQKGSETLETERKKKANCSPWMCSNLKAKKKKKRRRRKKTLPFPPPTPPPSPPAWTITASSNRK